MIYRLYHLPQPPPFHRSVGLVLIDTITAVGVHAPTTIHNAVFLHRINIFLVFIKGQLPQRTV